MRIRHVLPHPALGVLPLNPLNDAMTGVVNTAWNLAVRQAEDGHDVEMICPTGGQRLLRQCITGVKVFRLPLRKRWRVTSLDLSYLMPLFLFVLTARKVDVLHVHANPYLVMRAQTRATVLHYHGPPIKSSPRYDRAVSRADAVICCSQFVRREFVTTVSYPGERVYVVYNGADWELFAKIDRAVARATFHIPNDQVVLLYAGRVAPEKVLLVLVKALQRVVSSGVPNVLLMIAGSARLGYELYKEAWPDLQSYEQIVREYASNLPVRFLGDVSRAALPAFFRAGDIFVCPSVYQEPFGMVNIEAGAAGLPLIATSVGGIPEFVMHEDNGLLVPPEDDRALADALVRLISDKALRYRLARAAQEMAQRFDWRVLKDQVMVIYGTALG